MRSYLIKILPWLITCIALYYAFRGIEWQTLLSYLGSVDFSWLAVAFSLTCMSYLLRARRWQFLFPKPVISFWNATKVLILGFFMNNLLPARAGELVRAHMGAQVTGETRTLVLATIASERLADGLTLSLMFVIFALHVGDERVSANLLYVAYLFGVVAIAVFVLLIFRQKVFRITEKINSKFNSKLSQYACERIQIFINGLGPLFTFSRSLTFIVWCLIIWSVELLVYVAISRAFDAALPLPYCVLFLVTVNFSSLIPAAPGGLGVIEAVGAHVLNSIGVQKELALTMVMAQHLIQILVVGIPGTVVMLTWRKTIEQLQHES